MREPRGTPVLIDAVCERSAHLGHRVTVVCGTRVDAAPRPYRVLPVRSDAAGLPNRLGARRAAVWEAMVRAVASLMRAERPDVVWAHHAEALLVCMAAQVRRTAPLVFVQHAALAHELDQWVPPGLGAAARCAAAAADRVLPRAADFLVTVTAVNRAQALASGVLPERIALLPPLAPAPLPPVPQPHRVSRIVYAGNLDAYQGWTILVAAMDLLARRSGVSPAPEVLLLTRDAPRVVPPRCTVVVPKDLDHEAHLARTAAFAVIPRPVGGGVPIKLVNFAAWGLPAVVLRDAAPGFDDRSAHLVPRMTPQTLAEAISALCADRGRRQRLAAALPHLVRSRFSPPVFDAVLEDVYATVRAGRRASPTAIP